MRGRARFGVLDVYESSVAQISKILIFLTFLRLLLATKKISLILKDGFLGFVLGNEYGANSTAQGRKR